MGAACRATARGSAGACGVAWLVVFPCSGVVVIPSGVLTAPLCSGMGDFISFGGCPWWGWGCNRSPSLFSFVRYGRGEVALVAASAYVNAGEGSGGEVVGEPVGVELQRSAL